MVHGTDALCWMWILLLVDELFPKMKVISRVGCLVAISIVGEVSG